jgi:cytoplasmic iron level regulating protein YaaA (DUF328/UPF0246 family)
MYATTSFNLPTDNPEFEHADTRAEAAEVIRQQLDPEDVLAELDYLLSGLHGTKHPLYALAQHCVTVGTTAETGKRPSMSEFVGAALEPWLQMAIENLVSRALGEH